MIELLKSLPLWFVMLLISAGACTLIFILARADRIKAGPIEIDNNENKDEVQK